MRGLADVILQYSLDWCWKLFSLNDKNHVSGLIARELHGKRQGAAVCLMTACCEEQWKLLTPAKKEKTHGMHPASTTLQFCFFLFFSFPRFFCPWMSCLAHQGGVDNDPEHHPGAKRWSTKDRGRAGGLLHWLLGWGKWATSCHFHLSRGLSWNLANVGTWGKQHILVMKPEMQSSQLFRVYFFASLHFFNMPVWNQIESGECSTNGCSHFDLHVGCNT